MKLYVYRHLLLINDPVFLKKYYKSVLVYLLEKPTAEFSMNLHCKSDDPVRKFAMQNSVIHNSCDSWLNPFIGL